MQMLRSPMRLKGCAKTANRACHSRMTVKPPWRQCEWKSSSKSDAIRKNGSMSKSASFVGESGEAVEAAESGRVWTERRRKS